MKQNYVHVVDTRLFDILDALQRKTYGISHMNFPLANAGYENFLIGDPTLSVDWVIHHLPQPDFPEQFIVKMSGEGT